MGQCQNSSWYVSVSQYLHGLHVILFVEMSWQTHHEQLYEFTHDTPVGAVLEAVGSENCEELYKLYLHDFVMSMHRCKHKSSDLTTMELQVA